MCGWVELCTRTKVVCFLLAQQLLLLLHLEQMVRRASERRLAVGAGGDHRDIVARREVQHGRALLHADRTREIAAPRLHSLVGDQLGCFVVCAPPSTGDQLAAPRQLSPTSPSEKTQPAPTARRWVGNLLGLAAADEGVDLAAVVDTESTPPEVAYFYRSEVSLFSFEEGFEGPSSPRDQRRTSSSPRTGRQGSGTRKAPSGRSGSRSAGPSRGGGGDRFRIRFSMRRGLGVSGGCSGSG